MGLRAKARWPMRRLGKIPYRGNHFAVTDILNKNYYIELSDYMSTSSKSAQQFAEDPLAELVFRTFFRSS